MSLSEKERYSTKQITNVEIYRHFDKTCSHLNLKFVYCACFHRVIFPPKFVAAIKVNHALDLSHIVLMQILF